MRARPLPRAAVGWCLIPRKIEGILYVPCLIQKITKSVYCCATARRALCCYSAVMRLSLLVCATWMWRRPCQTICEQRHFGCHRSMFIGSCDPVILFILHHAPVAGADIRSLCSLSLLCVGGVRTPQPHSFQVCGIGSSHLWHFIGNILSQKHSRRNSKSSTYYKAFIECPLCLQ